MLGPILFICYINSMPETVSSFLYMYADDTKVFRRVDVDGATIDVAAEGPGQSGGMVGEVAATV